MTKQFSDNTVLLDTTHKCSSYKNYLLGTIMIADEKTRQGVSLAFYICKGESEDELGPIFD